MKARGATSQMPVCLKNVATSIVPSGAADGQEGVRKEGAHDITRLPQQFMALSSDHRLHAGSAGPDNGSLHSKEVPLDNSTNTVDKTLSDTRSKSGEGETGCHTESMHHSMRKKYGAADENQRESHKREEQSGSADISTAAPETQLKRLEDQQSGNSMYKLRSESARNHDVSLLPELELTKRKLHLMQDDTWIAEVKWEPEHVVRSKELRQWLTDEFLHRTTLSVIVAYKWVTDNWVALLMACQDDELEKGGFAKGYGLFALRDTDALKLIVTLGGRSLGKFKLDSAARDRRIASALAGHNDSYLFERWDGVTKRIELVDGRYDEREGGGGRANSARGLPNATDNARLDESGNLISTRIIQGLKPTKPMWASGIYYDYGDTYWRWQEGRWALGRKLQCVETRRIALARYLQTDGRSSRSLEQLSITGQDVENNTDPDGNVPHEDRWRAWMQHSILKSWIKRYRQQKASKRVLVKAIRNRRQELRSRAGNRLLEKDDLWGKEPSVAEREREKKLLQLQQRLQRQNRQLKILTYQLALLADQESEKPSTCSDIETVRVELEALERDLHIRKPKSVNGMLSRPMLPLDSDNDRAVQVRPEGVVSEQKHKELKVSIDKVRKGYVRSYEQLMLTIADEAKKADGTEKTPESTPLLNPKCTTKPADKNCGDVAVPNGMQVSRDMLYCSIDTRDFQLLQTERELEIESEVKTYRLYPQREISANTKDGDKGPVKSYQCVTAELLMGSGSGGAALIKAVIDSGAAWSAIALDALREKFPELAEQIQPVSNARFLDASDRVMPVKGYVRMHICVEGFCFWTTVYVFETLGVPFLLGVNSLCDGDLVIHARKEELFSMNAPEEKTKVACSKGALPGKPSSCDCCGKENVAVMANVKTQTLEISRGQQVVTIKGETESLLEPIPELTPTGRQRMMVPNSVRIPARSGERQHVVPVPLEFTEWQVGPEVGIKMYPSEELRKLGLQVAEVTRHSSMNGRVFLKVSNLTDQDIEIPGGITGAWAEPETGARSPTGQPLDEQEERPSRILLAAQLESLEELQNRPFSEGGPPVTDEDFKELLGLDLEQCIDPTKPLGDGKYEPLARYWVDRIKELATRWWLVWSRDARAPRISHLVIVDVPTGEARPIAQKPYPIPRKYLNAVRDELQKLLDAGLIEPGISNWASPTLLTVKKDSTLDSIKIKIVVDYRLLNSSLLQDTGSLGTQEEIISAFGGGQKFVGIADIAGGFYQFALNPNDRHKTAFVLPSSMGGTTFQWRVCPYGLARAPAAYSRGMMFALQGMTDVALSPLGQSHGGVHTWIDDLIFHADTIEGFVDLLGRLFERLVYAGLSLKASKTHLLRESLDILGFVVTPEGLQMQESKVEAIKRIPYPSDLEEVQSYLGSVNFYRRFVPHIGTLAKPLTDMTGSRNKEYNEEAVKQAVDAINSFLTSSAFLAFPDFNDPNAEFAICTDASEVAIGGVLMQWQWPKPGMGPGPPPDVKIREKTGDPLLQSWREKAGWELRTLGYFSKTLDMTQCRYNVFDKEAGAILYACRQYANIITGYPTTIYTDSSVAKSMLTKYKGTPRLQRWGLELQALLPYLKIGYRKGSQNGMADLLSRFPYFKKYVRHERDVIELPDDLYEQVAEVHLQQGVQGRKVYASTFCTKSGHVKLRLSTASIRLYEPAQGKEVEEIWQEGHPTEEDLEQNQIKLNQVAIVRQEVVRTKFYQEQQAYEQEQAVWSKYVQAFKATKGRAPILYDLYAGEGGFSRGARAEGVECYGFEINEEFKRNYDTDAALLESGISTRVDSGMRMELVDVDSEVFWKELKERGRYKQLPPPDVIHASPPCSCFTKIRNLADNHSADPMIGRGRINNLIKRLQDLEQSWDRPLVWQIENVPESVQHVHQRSNRATLCGTMFGHHVLRHRVIYSNYSLEVSLDHDHTGKLVGSRGLTRGLVPDAHEPNLFGVYSRRQIGRGSYDEWHGALGHELDTFSRKGISGVLPLGYGRYCSSQMVARLMEAQFGVPIFKPKEINEHQRAMLEVWAEAGLPESWTGPLIKKFTGGGHICNVLADAPDLPVGKADAVQPERSEEASPYEFGAKEQAADPHLARILEQLRDPESSLSKSGDWCLKGGILYKAEVIGGKSKLVLAAPKSLAHEIMHHSHNTLNTGHRSKALYSDLKGWYYWKGMKADCAKFVLHCKLCSGQKPTPATRVPPGMVPMPSRPFETIHIDYKSKLIDSGGYKNILVVVDALTRYVIFIPTADTTAVTTLRALLTNVFCHYGIPRRIVSDNGPEFDCPFQEHLAQYLGYRKVHVLPWNPQANGLAESAVKRIKTLLTRHTSRLRNWHKTLPLAQYTLNCSAHHGIKMSPFEALFGREPVRLPNLENQHLSLPDGTGSEFIQGLRDRLSVIHAWIKEESDKIRRLRQLHEMKNTPQPTVQVHAGDTVWLQFRNADYARRIRKSGRGLPWRHSYKVKAVSEFAVQVEPIGDSPVVSEWQPLHKVYKSPIRFNDDDFSITVDSYGFVYAPGQEPSRSYRRRDDEPFEPKEVDESPTWKPGEIFEVEKILKAEKRAGTWYVTVKWEGWREPTEERRKDILEECSTEVRRMVMDECARAQMGKRSTGIEDLDEFDETDSSDPDEAKAESASDDGVSGQYAIAHQELKDYELDSCDINSIMCVLDAYTMMLKFAF